MIELYHILLFLAVISPLAVLARGWRSEAASSWRNAAFIVLGITGVAWIFFRHEAGFVGAGAWLMLLFLPAVGLKRVTELAALRRYTQARRLAAALQILHPSRELREQVQFFRTLELRQTQGLISAPSVKFGRRTSAFRDRLSGAWAVTLLIVVNMAVFAVEGRSSTDPVILSKLGALDPVMVVWGHQYWRLGTALFLHYGIAHLLFNLFALYIIGPALERAIGGVRFLICYLVSGLGSSAGVVLLMLARIVQPAQLVGASGCVMGVVGAWAGYLLLHRHAPDAKKRLSNILLIIAVQVAFDLSTPQVSMSAHLCGLVTGFFLGLAITPRDPAQARQTRLL
ncbi:MAG TPA: rhomboid family intramembrane serine protease [Chthoniobacterales bacterium]